LELPPPPRRQRQPGLLSTERDVTVQSGHWSCRFRQGGKGSRGCSKEILDMIRWITALVLVVLVTTVVVAQQRRRPILPGEDWVALFSGKDLTGWVEVGKEKWEVEDGTIHGRAISKAYGYLRTEKKFVDFHLAMRFKCEGDGNSGLFFHVDFKPGTPDVSQGLQFEIDCVMNKHTAGIYGDGRQWIVWPSPDKEGVVRQTDWNDLQVRVEGNRYMSRLNGVDMVDFTDPSPRSSDGYIALQLHSGGEGNMRFKDIYLRDLTKR
jgi:hypothetical protein